MFEKLFGWLGGDKKGQPENPENQADPTGLKGFMENIRSFFRGAVDSFLEKLGIETETRQQLQEFQRTIETEAVPDMPESGSTLMKKMQIFGRNDAEVKKNLVPMRFLDRPVNVHHKVKSILEKVSQQIREYEKRQGIKSGWNPVDVQCQNWRDIRGMKGQLSNHCFGGTLDFDPQHNGLTYADVDPSVGKNTNIPEYVVRIFKSNGYDWGGDYKRRKDPMHFEPSARLINSLG